MPRRYFSFLLHAHLPWVLGYGRWPHGVEWVCEACLGTYLPLVRAMRRLHRRGVRGGLTLSVSPVLAEQLAHERFGPVFREYVEERSRTAREDARRFARTGHDDMADLARRWSDFYEDALRFLFDDLGGDLIDALADLERRGSLELATCAATHGYLPLLGRDETVALQLELARRVHARHFGREPDGLWLPEMAYRPAGPWRPPVGRGPSRERAGLEQLVGLAGFRWVPVDTSLLRGDESPVAWSELLTATTGAGVEWPAAGSSRPRSLPHDPRRSYRIASNDPSGTTSCFVRDAATSLQVWSGRTGYPGDGAYLEFHKKSDSGGHRYWKVTAPHLGLGEKQSYRPEDAAARVVSHASHFRSLVTAELEDGPDGAILMAPYDAELFGHWWFEGIAWMERALEQLHADPRVLLTTLGRHLSDVPPESAIALPEGSWGSGGGHGVWRNPRVDWTWELVLPAEEEMWRLWARAEEEEEEEARAVLRVAARQLLLLVASDWAFLMTTNGAPDYAAERVRGHAEDLAHLLDLARRLLRGGDPGDADREFLRGLETRDDLFPEMDDALAAAVRDAARVAVPGRG